MAWFIKLFFDVIKQMIPDINKYDEEEFLFALIDVMDKLIKWIDMAFFVTQTDKDRSLFELNQYV